MKNFHIAICFIIVLISHSCKPKKEYFFYEGLTQGTTFHISYKAEKNLNKELEKILSDFSSEFSIYDSLSTISKINNNDTSVILSDRFIYLLDVSKKINHNTEGLFDITVGPIVKAWGFGFKTNQLPDSNTIDSLLNIVGFEKITYKNNRINKSNKSIFLDCNAIAQGFSTDVVSEFLEQNDVKHYLVEIGGEVRAKGVNKNKNTWRIGVDKPIEGTDEFNRELQSVIVLDNRSLATSGNYRKFFIENGVKYSHTINPKTGYPAKNTLLSVTVLAEKCIDADAYATSFMVMGFEKSVEFLEKHKELDAYFIYSDSDSDKLKEYYTKGFTDIISEAEN